MTDKKDISIERHPLQPFLPRNARLLMLGSFPPPQKRWCMDFFYPNRTNMMWQVFGEVFFNDRNRLVDYENKTFRLNDIVSLLEEKGIAVFDVASSVCRLHDNASDKYLEIVEKTDIARLLEKIPNCHDLVCTGQKSAETICEDFSVALPKIGCFSDFLIANRRMRLHRVPSTSAAYPMPVAEKAEFYRKAFSIAGIEI